MKRREDTTTTQLGFIVAVILENTNQSQSSNSDGSPKNPNDLREHRQAENPSTNPDPELEDPNFVPQDDEVEIDNPRDDLLEDEPEEEILDDDDLDIEEDGLEEEDNDGNFL